MKRAIVLAMTFALGIGVGFVARGGIDRPVDRPSVEAAPPRIPTSAVVNVMPVSKRILQRGDPFDEIKARLTAWSRDIQIERLTDEQLYQAMNALRMTYVGKFPGDWLVQQELFGRRQLLCRHLTPGRSGYCG
jgi:hypothetical protein